MVNVTSEELGVGAGVLLRALEPLQGIEMMQRGPMSAFDAVDGSSTGT
jgi:3-methyladenine DNA glycosylase Mpg